MDEYLKDKTNEKNIKEFMNRFQRYKKIREENENKGVGN